MYTNVAKPRTRARASSETDRRRDKKRERAPASLRCAGRPTARTALRAGDAARHGCARAITAAPRPRGHARALARSLPSALAAPPASQARCRGGGLDPWGIDSESLSESRVIGTGRLGRGGTDEPSGDWPVMKRVLLVCDLYIEIVTQIT